MDRAAGFLRDAPLLVVSPHFDDVALSCAALVARPAPLTVLTVCTTGPTPAVAGEWDRRAGFADSDAATAGRRAEERAAFADTPHELRELGLLDGQYGDGLDRAGRARLGEAVGAWLESAGADATVALPVGAGSPRSSQAVVARVRAKLARDQVFPAHPDHLGVRDALVDALAGRPRTAIVLYEDYPYLTTRRGDDAARAVAARLGAAASMTVVEVAIDRAAKAARLGAYATQVPLLVPARAQRPGGLARHLPATERYWVVPPRP